MDDAVDSRVLISVTGPDKVGLIASITGRLYELGANLDDTSFAILGEGFEFSAVCELPSELALSQVEEALKTLSALDDATVRVETFELGTMQAENARITHRVEVSGGDRPGLIARLSEAFLDYGANVVRMNSVRIPASDGGASYLTNFSVFIPANRTDSCLAAIGNTAEQLECKCWWSEVQ